ncbi:MAG: F0F1 ATP synthase subunit B [Pseudomonadales bacterium]|nr:F0F1 ATP synthase subunit B [Pseudomonadales bacterium]
MLIDWFTVGAQVLNFLILVGLMKHFLYQPVLDAIDARDRGIAAKLADADAKDADAGKQRDAFKIKNEEFDRQRDELMRKATEDAKVERQRLLDDARGAAHVLSDKCSESWRNEVSDIFQTLSQRTSKEVFAIARKTMTDLAGVSLEARILDVFRQKLCAIDADKKALLSAARGSAPGSVLIRSSFDLSAEQQSVLETSAKDMLGVDMQVSFETNSALVSGIELSTHGQKLSWNIADYLGTLELGVNELLKERSIVPSPPNPAAVATASDKLGPLSTKADTDIVKVKSALSS